MGCNPSTMSYILCSKSVIQINFVLIEIYIQGHNEVPPGRLQSRRASELMAVVLRPDRGGHQEAAVLRGRDGAKTGGHGE